MPLLVRGITARSFGGLRMTEKGRASSPGLHPIIVILRPPKDLVVLPFEERCAKIR
jgi:hypothetical protein